MKKIIISGYKNSGYKLLNDFIIENNVVDDYYQTKCVDISDILDRATNDNKYILVYSSPAFFIKKSCELKDISIENIDIMLSQWKTINRNLLSFYYKYLPQCVLVSFDEFTRSKYAVCDTISIKFNIKTDFTVESTSASQDLTLDMGDMIIESLVRCKDDATNLFEEIQSIADLPYNDELDNQKYIAEVLNVKDKYIDLNNSQLSIMTENGTLNEKVKSLTSKNEEANKKLELTKASLLKIAEDSKESAKNNLELLELVSAKSQEIEANQKKIKDLEKTVLANKRYFTTSRDQILEHQNMIIDLNNKIDMSSKSEKLLSNENEKLLSRLEAQSLESKQVLENFLLVQEKLEKSSLSCKSTEQNLIKIIAEKDDLLSSISKLEKQNNDSIESIIVLKEKLEQITAENTNASKKSATLSKENTAMLENLMLVQEEYEKLYINNVLLKETQQILVDCLSDVSKQINSINDI